MADAMTHGAYKACARGAVALDTADTTSLDGVLGIPCTFRDIDSSSTAKIKPKRSGAVTTGMLVRNVSGIALLPGRIVAWKTGKRYKEVDGYTTATAAEAAGVVDEHLPTSGAAANAIFWIFGKGPHLVLTDLTGDTDTNFSNGAVLAAITAVSSQSTTSGRMREADHTGATALLADMIRNEIGIAMSANTTGQTNRKVLVDLRIWK